MKNILSKSLAFLTVSERRTFVALLVGRCLTTFLDLLGVLALGYLATSVALFISKGSDATRSFSLLGITIPAANIQNLPWILLATFLLFVLKATFSIVLTRRMAINFALTEARAARQIAEGALGGGLSRARKLSQEELLFVVTSGASSAFSGLFNNLATIVSEGFLFIGLVLTFIVIDPLSTVVVLSYFAIVAFLIHYFTGTKIARQSTILVRNALDANKALIDLSSGFRELAVLNKREKYFRRLEAARRASAQAIGTQLYLAGMPRYIVETAVLFGVLAFAGVKLLAGDLSSSVTTLAIFLTGSMRIVAAMLPWQAALVSIKGNVPQAALAIEYLYPDDLVRQSSRNFSREDHSVTQAATVDFTGVHFSFDATERETLRDLSFSIKPGSMVSFIGASGAGKSTIADLIVGLLAPSRGSIEICGKSPTEIIAAAPGYIAYVPQSPGALSGTIRENITLVDSEVPVNETNLEYALNHSFLSDVIQKLPNGINTDLGSHRDSLSGGQIQRIGLARALYARPKLLVLDEATSSLDAQSENEVAFALKALRGEVTVIVIAHRLNTVQDSDMVFLVDQGKIVDSGDFFTLAKRNHDLAQSIKLMSVRH